ncbi:MAG TPA: SpoIID/LytB domain-containing protein, partial [Thermoanaerobaculia bacterium]
MPSPQPAQSENALTSVGNVGKTIAEPRIRVGMLSDQASVTFPRINGGYDLITDSGASTLRRGFTDSAPLPEVATHYAVQAGAFADAASANALAAQLRSSGQRADVVSDNVLNRVLVGDFATSQEATALRDQIPQSTIVRRPTDQPFQRVHKIVDDEGQQYTINAESILVLPASADTITIDQKPYRGGARVFINNRGQFNIINELNLEEYLFGVVPAEMGPKVFDELEGEKAQAVAARTYAVRNLGQFRSEGYDICPTPACQAYNGFSGEDPLSNQAVRETAGLIMTYEGKPIDALFTATCGGETSDVSTMFPTRTDPYLKRVRCVELDMTTLAGRIDTGILNETQFNGMLFAVASRLTPPTSWAAGDVQNAVLTAARAAGFSVVPANPPASSRRGDVLVYLANVFGFDRYATAVTLPEDRPYFFPQSPADQRPYLAAAFLIKYGFLPAQEIDRIDLNSVMPHDELYSLLASWLRKHNALTEANGKILTITGRTLTLKAEGKTSTFNLPDGIPIWRKLADRWQEYKSAPVMIGDRATVELDARKQPIGLVVQANVDGASFDRTSSFANWTRSYRADELVASIAKRAPIKQLLGLRPLSVDASQRVAEMEFTAEGGRTFTLKGLPIRWALNIPDNLFVFEKTTDPDGVDRYTFYGKGWGHGVGMCQVGAYGMAFRGYKFDQIL